jgi:hypothetical protein
MKLVAEQPQLVLLQLVLPPPQFLRLELLLRYPLLLYLLQDQWWAL